VEFSSSVERTRYSANAGDLVNRFSLFPVILGDKPSEIQRVSRGNPSYFQRTIVRYTWFGHMTDIGLYLVLQTRPGLPPPRICLPSTLPGVEHTCTSTRAFASGFLQACIAALPLPLATLRLRQAGYGLCPVFVSQYRTSPISSRALPGTHRDRRKPHSAPLPHHAAYGSVLRDSADQAESDPGEQKST